MPSIAARGDGFQNGMFQVISPGISQVLTVNSGSVTAASFSSGVSIIRLFSTVDAWISFGSAPVAIAENANSMFLPGGIVEYFEIKSGETLAVIQSVSSGKLYITEGGTQ